MGDRASVGYQRTADNSFVFFYGHWIGDNTIDAVSKALTVEPNVHNLRPYLVGQLSNQMFEFTEGSVDITPYAFGGNNPTLLVREYNGKPEVAIVEADFDEELFNESEVVWCSGDQFVDYADMTTGLSGSARFEAIERMILKGF